MSSQEIEDNDSVEYKRPLLVRIIGILSIIFGALYTLIGMGGTLAFSLLNEFSSVSLPIAAFHMSSSVIAVSGISVVLMGWGLLKMKPWAWIMIMFSLLASVLYIVYIIGEPQSATSEIPLMIGGAVIMIPTGFLAVYFYKKKEYFNVETLPTKNTLMIIGGLVTFSIIQFAVLQMTSTTMTEWLNELVRNKELASI